MWYFSLIQMLLHNQVVLSAKRTVTFTWKLMPFSFFSTFGTKFTYAFNVKNMKISHFPDKLGDTPGPQGQVQREEGERVVEPVHQRHHVQPKVSK
jgi:hypothetical protein